ncbi:hypothetical protein V8G54_005811 [Vigna mungo]|uniref:Uncharacterized protein n=1 Tax=Vigna mungo TaxID=3915 RepID=A0AAQ3S409_VIGMU
MGKKPTITLLDKGIKIPGIDLILLLSKETETGTGQWSQPNHSQSVDEAATGFCGPADSGAHNVTERFIEFILRHFSGLSSSQSQSCFSSTNQQFLFYSLECTEELLQLNLTKRLVGYNEEIVDMKFLGDDEKFLALATNLEQNGASGDTIRCPCPKCGFVKWQARGIVEEHLILKQFPINYVIWNLHGERQRQDISRNEDESQETFHFENPMETMINEAFGHYRQEGTNIGRSQPLGEDDVINERPRENHNEFNEFLHDGNQILCDGSKAYEMAFFREQGWSYKASKGCEAWKTFSVMHPEFALDPRNVRLGLASDGFNPFGTMSSTYSIWPVFLIPYNLPPWLCMKHTSLILSMIIPGKQMPGNSIDVYLQPLVDELRELWNDGVETFDSSLNETFRMRAALMWTISDFPGLGILSGWNTHTGLACPTCNFDAEPCRLPHSRKWCFMGHRRFLSRNHRFRLNRVRFDGSTEERNPPLKLSGSDIFRQVENINVTFGKGIHFDGKGKRCRQEVKQWNKRSIFFELPYWESNLLRHNLDFMHIEKNVFDNLIYTLLNEKPKSKDNLNARKDLKEMGIRQDLWPDDNGRYHLALFSLTRDTKRLFLKTLKNVLVPDGYSCNISRCVDDVQHKISGLKSHDCHIIMEQLLPLAIRNLLPNHVTATLVEFCSFFKALCSKSLNLEDLEMLQNRIVVTLCHLEMLFPPSFFTVMVHLTVHLVEEAKLGGPTFVRNKAQPEGSIAEGYLAEESLTFCSRYIEDIETRFNRQRRVCDNPNDNECFVSSIFPLGGKVVGGSSMFTLTHMQKLQAHRYVLLNCAIVTPFVEDLIKRRSRGRRPSTTEIETRVFKEFVDWFQRRIMNPETINSMSTDLKFLARGPLDNARRFTAYNINGFKFRTLTRDEGLRTQNSGVFLTSNTACVSSTVDRNLRQADLSYYGKLEDIIELNYYGRFKVVLFKCKWVDTTRERGYKKDQWNFNCVNFDRLIHIGNREEHEPYIEASQAQMVYYVDDVVNEGWSVAVHLKPRDLYEIGEEVQEELYENEPYQVQELEKFYSNDNEYVQLATNHLDEDIN